VLLRGRRAAQIVGLVADNDLSAWSARIRLSVCDPNPTSASPAGASVNPSRRCSHSRCREDPVGPGDGGVRAPSVECLASTRPALP